MIAIVVSELNGNEILLMEANGIIEGRKLYAGSTDDKNCRALPFKLLIKNVCLCIISSSPEHGFVVFLKRRKFNLLLFHFMEMELKINIPIGP